MTAWRWQGAQSDTLADGAAAAAPILGTRSTAGLTEAQIQTKIYVAYTFSDFAIYVADADANAISYLRDDGVSSSNLSVAGSATGFAEDLTGTDTPAANSLISRYDDDSASMHGATYQVTWSAVTYEHASTDAPVNGDAGTASIGATPASGTRYFAPNARVVDASEAPMQSTVRRATGFNSLRAYLTTAAASGNTIALRNNGSTSSNVTVSPTASGAVEDITGSESFADGDLVNMIGIAGSGTDLTVSSLQVQQDTAENLWANGEGRNTSSTAYAYLAGHAGLDNVFTLRIGSVSAGNLEAYCSVYNSGTDTYAFRINGSTSSNLTVSITGTGQVEDITGSDSIADTDEVNFILTAGGGTTFTALGRIELPWSTGTTNIDLAGAQPASTGALSFEYQIALTGSQPASSGAIAAQQTLAISVAGAQPAASGGVSAQYEIALAGSQPAASGDVSTQLTIGVAVAGSQPAASGDVTVVYSIALAGSQPASSGTIAAQQTFLRSLTGSQPASSGTLSAQQTLAISLAGSQPAASGDITAVYVISLAGSQPAASGALSAQQTLARSLVGSQPASSGALSAQQTLLVSLAGSQPASTGDVVGLYLIALTGSQPAASGTISSQSIVSISLTGSQPASTGALTQTYLIALAGDQPASTGAIDALQTLAISLTGNQPNATGALSVQIGQDISLAGNQPAASGALSVQQTLARSLSGNQPASTGTASVLYVISVTGSQPASTGAISSQSIVAVNLTGSQPSASGDLTALYLIAVAGSQPAASGTLGAQQTLLVSVVGSQPAGSGALSILITYLVALAGSQPAGSGALVAVAINADPRGTVTTAFMLIGGASTAFTQQGGATEAFAQQGGVTVEIG